MRITRSLDRSAHRVPATKRFVRALCVAVAGVVVSPLEAADLRYEAYLWHYKGPEKNAELAKAMKALGIGGSNVDGMAAHDFAVDHRLAFYVGHVAGKGTLFLRDEAYKPLWDAYYASRDRKHLVRPFCLSDGTVIDALRAKIKETIEKHREAGPDAYALDDEISLTSYANPFDFCFCDRCFKGFRTWLRKTYESVEELNRTWNTRYESFAEAAPASTDEIRQVLGTVSRSDWNMAPWIDYRAYMDRLFAHVIEGLVADARSIDPTTPVGFVGGQAPNAFGGHDYALLVPAVSYLEAYDIGSARELIRSFDSERMMIHSTYFPPAAGREWVNVYRLWYLFAHGDSGAILWSAEDAFTAADPGKPTSYVRAMTSTLRELSGSDLAPILASRFQHDGIGILYSPASLRVQWMIDSWDDGRTWPKRYGSFERDHSSTYAEWESWQKLLEDIGLQYRYVSSDELGSGDIEDFTVLILPKTIALSVREVAAIRRFVAAGGTLIADAQIGLFDDHGQARGADRGHLDDLFGVFRIDSIVAEKYGALRPLLSHTYQGIHVMEPGLRVSDTNGGEARAVVDGVPVVVSRLFPDGGRTWYLNLAVRSYREDRLTPGGGSTLRALMADLLYRADILPQAQVQVRGQRSPRIERILYDPITPAANGRRYLILLQNGSFLTGPTGKTELQGIEAGPLLDLTVTLRGVHTVTNLRTGQRLGKTRAFTDTLDPVEANVYELIPAR